MLRIPQITYPGEKQTEISARSTEIPKLRACAHSAYCLYEPLNLCTRFPLSLRKAWERCAVQW